MMKNLPKNTYRQRGAVLLVLLFMVFALAATAFLSSVNTHAVEIREHQGVRTEMEKARQALIAYALNFHTYGFETDGNPNSEEGPGRLICPDIDNDGLADRDAADCTDYVRGRLPESFSYSGNTVSLSDAFAGIDQQFWLVVSPAFKEITAGDVNELTVGDLTIDGETGYAAVIIAPGEALPGQDRSASQTIAGNYLEQDNLTSTTDFINYYPANPAAFNDQVIGIKASDLMLDRINDTPGTPDLFTRVNNARLALVDYWNTNGSLPADLSAIANSLRDSGNGWFVDEGHMEQEFSNVTSDPYPYIRYNLGGCTTYWYWFIPVAPYDPAYTYVSGTAC